ncbi:hypothetical protein [Lactococcus lactis]|uniref:Uncharacterized protein n=1 Tax=Lactococcus lactis TaxID=1358 RepID=A0AAP3Z110_9LACT|nr:hypothetical protein [Lactococcus lactis]MDG4968264.1 hypothetical protein [Lactococcus lactis]MDG4976376.1 hypothetical protein [Lactococcus lactis]MDG5102180.1 hypothetical protein [Lactococcus lactis]
MTEILINTIYGLGGILLIVCLLIWLKNINHLKKAVEKFESFTDEDTSPCEYPLDEKLKYAITELQKMTDLDNDKPSAHQISSDNAGALANHIEVWAHKILNEIS